ncbi:hypothetical protein HPTD01_1686 [Halomonas sp. TD01]|nr:hypothetical protein HPTD01_1686 [Halomonas sp. TD01]
MVANDAGASFARTSRDSLHRATVGAIGFVARGKRSAPAMTVMAK